MPAPVPHSARALALAGKAAFARGEHATAATALAEAVALGATGPNVAATLAHALMALGRNDEAVAGLRAAIERLPAHPLLLNTMALAVKAAAGPAAALPWLRRALLVDPADATALNNLGGILLHHRGDAAGAAAAFRQVTGIAPAYAGGHANLALASYRLGDLAAALAAAERALAIEPGHVEAHLHRAHALLGLGRYAEGFAAYEWRHRRPGALALPAPEWTGGDPAGLVIAVHAEQGIGDTIQFARFVPELARRGARPILACDRRLVPLLARLPGAPEVVDAAGPLPACDGHVPVMSLAHRLGIALESVPAAVPYLTPDPALVAAWGRWLPADGRLKVGLCWQGNPGNGWDTTRSAPLAALMPLAQVPNVALVSLQKGPGGEQAAAIAGDALIHLPDLDERGGAFADTMAVMAHCDVVVTVDTATAHLAGALGRPTFVLLGAAADWRWLTGRDDSPWYPTARLFRQPEPGAWAPVVARVGAALTRLCR